MRTCDDLRGGLNSISVQLGMERIHGPAHQASATARRSLGITRPIAGWFRFAADGQRVLRDAEAVL